MPKDATLKKILLLGSGPIVIGQACEFDYSGTQAARALKAEGYAVVLVNSNPATIMTDPEMADRVYIEPLTKDFLETIIAAEKPDAILPTMGGQTALNLACELAEAGILEKHGVRMLGADLASIKKAEDRALFKKTMLELGIDVPKSRLVQTLEEGLESLHSIGLPMILRPSFTLGGEGGGIAHTREEFMQILERGLFLSPTGSVLVEESLAGWKEYELEVVRDRKDNVIIVCSIENLDPMGIHTGDSITVAPAQTLTDRQFQALRDQAKKIIRAIGVETGGSNIQFAVKPRGEDAGRTVVIEMNPRVSRSSALASKATGFPIAKVAARLAVGYTLDELQNEITGTTPASFEPAIDYVVTKIPRFDFEKFTASPPLLGTQMKSVGEVMAIGRTFKESFFKALASLENGKNWLAPTSYDDPSVKIDELEDALRKPLAQRIWHVGSALRRGVTVQRIHDLTGIDPWFLNQIKEVVDFAEEQAEKNLPIAEWETAMLLKAKRYGLLDRDIARLCGGSASSENEWTVRAERWKRGLRPSYPQVDTCAAEFQARTPYLYSSYGTASSEPPLAEESVLILGGGPNRIGQGIEFDYCCVHAALEIRDQRLKSVMVNCNPETVSTDYDVSSRLLFEPLTSEHVIEIARTQQKLRGVILQFGGQTPLNLAKSLQRAGIPILGTSVDSIDSAEDRKRFEAIMKELEPFGLKQPPNRTARTRAEAMQAAREIGYPLLLRPSYVLGGRGMRLVRSEDSLARFIDEAIEVSDKHPVLLDRFLSSAIEVDVDALGDGADAIIGGIMEHVEEAGVHSGDSACSLPPFTLGAETCARLREYTRLLAKKLRITGLMNVQFAVQGPEIYVLEANPRASRTVPFISKAVGVPLAKVATKLMLGKTLRELGMLEDLDLNVRSFNVKMPVFPFHKFSGADVLLGPEMRSTGEAMGRAKDFPLAYAKALLGAGSSVPLGGVAFLSIADGDKPAALEIAGKLQSMGFRLEATPGTREFLSGRGLAVEQVNKVSSGSPHCVDHLANGRYQLVINTTSNEQSVLDSYAIRRTALEKKVPYCTLLTTARAFVRAVESARGNHIASSISAITDLGPQQRTAP